MKQNKTWITMGIVFFVGAMTRIMWNRIGGVRGLPYLVQIITIVLIPIILFVIVGKERKKMNNFQYRLCKLFVIFFAVMAIIMCIIIVLSNSFPVIWERYKVVFEIIAPAFFLLFSIYMAIVTLRNIKNIK